jgi:phosphatidate cytidylyltransferase
MTGLLRSLTPSQQVALMFVTLFGLLLLATVAVVLTSLRELPDTPEGDARRADRKAVQRALRSSWLMAGVFWVSWAAGDTVATVLFALVAFFALREFVTLSPTRRGDHRSLILAFFVVLPAQFWLTGTGHFNLFTVFIPVYVFLALAVVSALADDPQHFLERNAKLQWGIMVCVYGMSHVPALLLLEFPKWDSGKNAFLVFFLAATVQTGMLVEHFATRQLRRKSKLQLRTPGISSSFSWRAWAAGVIA